MIEGKRMELANCISPKREKTLRHVFVDKKNNQPALQLAPFANVFF